MEYVIKTPKGYVRTTDLEDLYRCIASIGHATIWHESQLESMFTFVRYVRKWKRKADVDSWIIEQVVTMPTTIQLPSKEATA